MAATPNGSVVVWRSSHSEGGDTSSFSIQGQLLAADGSKVGDQFQVNSYTTNFQHWPSVGADAAGSFVVVWNSYGSNYGDTSQESVQGQRFAVNGVKLGDQFQINSYTTNRQYRPSLAVAPQGGFVVVWQSTGSDYSVDQEPSGRSILAQRFAPSGAKLGHEFQVNSDTTGDQNYPTVATDRNGNFVIVWRSESPTSLYNLLAQRFAVDGSRVGREFQVNTYTAGGAGQPSLAFDSASNFTVAWTSESTAGVGTSSRNIQAQRFGADAARLGEQFLVNTLTTGSQTSAEVAMLSDASFVIVWRSLAGYVGDSIEGQQFGADGSVVAHQFQVSSYTTSGQRRPKAAARANGELIVVWSSGGSYDGDPTLSIQAQRFISPLFTDGFESGDTSAWDG